MKLQSHSHPIHVYPHVEVPPEGLAALGAGGLDLVVGGRGLVVAHGALLAADALGRCGSCRSCRVFRMLLLLLL